MVRIAIALFLISSAFTVARAGPLPEAARNGDLDLVRKLIDEGEDLNGRDGYGETPLNISILERRVSVTVLLIDRGADVLARNRVGFTPLHAAAYMDDVETAELLLGRGAPVNDQENKAKVTPLSVASEEGNADVAAVLIRYGADVEKAEQNGYTPLTRALWRVQNEVVSLLLTSGAQCQPVEILEEPLYSECKAGEP